MPEETFETPQPRPEDGRPLDDGRNWPKIILAAVLGFGLLAASAYTGYYYGTQQVQQPEKPTPIVSQPRPEADRPLDETPEPTTPPSTGLAENWQLYSFEVARDNKFEIKVPRDWNIERKARTMNPVPGEIEYWTEEQLKKLEEGGFVETLNISKDGYILNIYFPGAFGMDFCFYPGAPAFPPYYNEEPDYDFGTLKEFERLTSQYGQYLRGKTALLVEGGEFKNMLYVKTCEKETNTVNYHGSIKGGFFTYYFPTNKPSSEYIEVMDEILRSFHSK